MKSNYTFFECRVNPSARQHLFRLGGGKGYADVGSKAAVCVDHDRKCEKIMRARK